jgi:glycosyltransferase involved in cell wall biosynthesis
MPEAVPVLEATSISCGGNHLRDWATFDAAARLLPAGRPIDSFGAPGVMKSEGRAQYRGRLDLALFWAALAQSRFVVIPLEADWRRAAGITVMAMAQAVGRPIVCSRIKAAEDHLRDEEDSLLVAPGDAAALADAIRRLDEDDALCERLAAGARKNRDLLATKTLASMLVNGATLPDLAARRHALAPVDVW